MPCKKQLLLMPNLTWCGVSRSLDAHFLSSDTLDSFSDPYFITLSHMLHFAQDHALPLSGTETNSSPDQLIAIGFPFPSSHILPLRVGSCLEVGLHTPRWGGASLPRPEGKDPSVSLPQTSS